MTNLPNTMSRTSRGAGPNAAASA